MIQDRQFESDNGSKSNEPTTPASTKYSDSDLGINIPGKNDKEPLLDSETTTHPNLGLRVGA